MNLDAVFDRAYAALQNNGSTRIALELAEVRDSVTALVAACADLVSEMDRPPVSAMADAIAASQFFDADARFRAALARCTGEGA